MLHLYNTLSREIELFKPLDSSGTVKVYCCGPTVYNYIHIGNLRAYLFEDFVIRSLRFLGYRLDVTMNITDIDDKTIRDSVAQSIPLLEFTEKYTQAFLEDMADVRIDPPTRIIPISTLVDEMIDMINVLIKK